MAERITKCNKCGSTEFKLLEGYEEKLLEELSYTIRVKACCDKCGNIFDFSTWTKEGERARDFGKVI